MKGDFSVYEYVPNPKKHPRVNTTGTLYQQGRVFTDRDGNAADAIFRHQRALLGRDTIGHHVVGVPAEDRDALKVLQAQNDGTDVRVRFNPGRGWVDGLHLHIPELAGADTLEWTAEYLGPPIQSPTPTVAGIADGTRDAVILEVWEEAFSAFQAPSDLIECALGGPDTTERVVLHHRLRLLRLNENEDCANLGPRLTDDLSNQGKLTVALKSPLTITGDCPVEVGGGYTGFEHFLYRIEIAEPDVNGARFKFSRFNGGLVGCGKLLNGSNEIQITANDQMINLSQLTNFYMEVLTPDPLDDPSYWRVAMTANATLTTDGLLTFAIESGTWPRENDTEVFFRLWDGIRYIDSFVEPTTGSNEAEFEQGIRLQFDTPTADLGNYRPGDFWTFPVRMAGVDFDHATWPNNAPPQGVIYHRAPLAILNWDGGAGSELDGPPGIHDCRHMFLPLTKTQTCCTFKVGDGLHSFGDFDSIQEAINHLPPEGGEICVLAGTFRENVTVNKHNVRIHGCGPRSRVVSNAPDNYGVKPVFHIHGSSRVHIETLYIEPHEEGIGILVEPAVTGLVSVPTDIKLAGLDVVAAKDSAIKVLGAGDVIVRDCTIAMRDLPTPWHGIYLRAWDALIERNTIYIVSGSPLESEGESRPSMNRLSNRTMVSRPTAGRGGLHIAGTSERVQVIDNLIAGGCGHGITLGSVVEFLNGEPTPDEQPWIIDESGSSNLRAPGDLFIPSREAEDNEPEYREAGKLYEIRIERNRIFRMGLAGIGVVGFFDLSEKDEFIAVDGLDILGNEIRGCLWREIKPIPRNMRQYMGYGAVTIADVESLRLYDNIIEDNGADHLYPVCGVFILHSEGSDICRNRILNTGAKSQTDTNDVRAGPRGGIVIVFGMPGIVSLELITGLPIPRQSGEPAVRIHDNIVSQPLGQALCIQALGPVSVRGNQLTSRGRTMRFRDPGFLAATVLIFNLGMSHELYLQLLVLATRATANPIDPSEIPQGDDEFISRPQRGIDDFKFANYMANGNILFANNQVLADLVEADVSLAASSVAIISLDDVSVQDNQFDCDLLLDFMITNLLAVGMTVRVNNNRFKEAFFSALFSSVELGLIFNNTSDNQATHCLLHLPSPLHKIPWLTPSIVSHHNQVLYNSILGNFFDRKDWCSLWQEIITGSSEKPSNEDSGPVV